MIAASRALVCIRLMTYEDPGENELLLSLFAGRDGNLQNTVFAMLAPDGETRLNRAGRSPGSVFGTTDTAPDAMARAMRRYARRFEKAAPSREAAPLAVPAVADLRLALDVAACDNRPLVVVFGTDAEQRARMEAHLAGVVWTERLVGRSEYVIVADPAELAPIAALAGAPKPGFHVIRPGTFGDRGRLLGSVAADRTGDALAGELDALLAKFRPRAKDRADHTATGRALGIEWKPRTPVTDTKALRRRR